MKVGLVTPHYPPDLTGSAEFVAHAQARELTARGHEVRVVTGCTWEHSGRDVLRGNIDDAPVSYLPTRADEASDAERPRWTRLALEELRGVEACVVHCGASLSADVVATLARRMPVVACVPDELERGAHLDDAASADRVLVDGADAEARLLETHPELLGRLEVSPSGLCRVLPPADRVQRRAHWDGVRPVTLFHFGARRRESGIEALLDGLRPLPGGRFELVLAGGEAVPGYDDRLTALADGLDVHFFGPYQTSQLATLAAACDLAVFPARGGSRSGHLIDEALALGLPVWCSADADPLGRIRPGTDAGRGRLERVESRPGRILPTASPAAWTRAFEDLLEDPEQLDAERCAIPRSFETTEDAVDRLESLLGALLSQTVRLAS